MTWEWSHSDEAEENVRANIFNKPREWLEVVFAEWCGVDPDDCNNLEEYEYKKGLKKAKTLNSEELAQWVWYVTRGLHECTDGGHEAHCCPFHCNCHSVSFDLEVEDEEENSEEEDSTGDVGDLH